MKAQSENDARRLKQLESSNAKMKTELLERNLDPETSTENERKLEKQVTKLQVSECDSNYLVTEQNAHRWLTVSQTEPPPCLTLAASRADLIGSNRPKELSVVCLGRFNRPKGISQ